MLRFFYLQTINRWKTLGRWIQFQLILLIFVISAYLINFIFDYIQTLPFTIWQASLIILTIFSAISIFQAPFIIKYSIPRQPTLQAFYGLPLDKKSLINLLNGYFYSGQTAYLIIFLLITISVMLINVIVGLLLLTTFLILNHFIFRMALLFLNRFNKDPNIETLYPITKQLFAISKTRPKRITFSSTMFISLIKRHLYGLWRNPKYRQLKLFTFFIYLAGQLVLYFSGIPQYDKWMMFFSAAVFWFHYNLYFNRKYVTADPDWFYKTLPVPFWKQWISKFSSEIVYVLFLIGCQAILLLILGNNLLVFANWIGALLLFSTIVLTIVINFQIMFYDNLRQASYSYHFTILFIVITSVNYRFVGPLVALLLLTFYFIKTYRFYNS